MVTGICGSKDCVVREKSAYQNFKSMEMFFDETDEALSVSIEIESFLSFYMKVFFLENNGCFKFTLCDNCGSTLDRRCSYSTHNIFGVRGQ